MNDVCAIYTFLLIVSSFVKTKFRKLFFVSRDVQDLEIIVMDLVDWDHIKTLYAYICTINQYSHEINIQIFIESKLFYACSTVLF
jgi:predicted HAD superfamily hydrolase